jgi:hypothetical protein
VSFIFILALKLILLLLFFFFCKMEGKKYEKVKNRKSLRNKKNLFSVSPSRDKISPTCRSENVPCLVRHIIGTVQSRHGERIPFLFLFFFFFFDSGASCQLRLVCIFFMVSSFFIFFLKIFFYKFTIFLFRLSCQIFCVFFQPHFFNFFDAHNSKSVIPKHTQALAVRTHICFKSQFQIKVFFHIFYYYFFT